MINYREKYLKYKTRYLNLKNHIGGDENYDKGFKIFRFKKIINKNFINNIKSDLITFIQNKSDEELFREIYDKLKNKEYINWILDTYSNNKFGSPSSFSNLDRFNQLTDKLDELYQHESDKLTLLNQYKSLDELSDRINIESSPSSLNALANSNTLESSPSSSNALAREGSQEVKPYDEKIINAIREMNERIQAYKEGIITDEEFQENLLDDNGLISIDKINKAFASLKSFFKLKDITDYLFYNTFIQYITYGPKRDLVLQMILTLFFLDEFDYVLNNNIFNISDKKIIRVIKLYKVLSGSYRKVDIIKDVDDYDLGVINEFKDFLRYPIDENSKLKKYDYKKIFPEIPN